MGLLFVWAKNDAAVVTTFAFVAPIFDAAVAEASEEPSFSPAFNGRKCDGMIVETVETVASFLFLDPGDDDAIDGKTDVALVEVEC